MKTRYICFEVSSVCNMNCKFCFADWRNIAEQLPLKKVESIIKFLKEYGLEAINLTGGDPLMRDDIIEIARYCKSLGLITIISTSGILLPQKQEVLNYIDAINLPLDSFNHNIHNEMRPNKLENHHGHILNLIEFISSNYKNVEIKINTMVGKTNIEDVINIPKLFSNKVDKWKLSKFFASGYGANFKDKYEITTEEYNNLLKKAIFIYGENLLTKDEYEQNASYVFIDSKGVLNYNHNGEIKKISDIKEIDKLDNIDDRAWKLDIVYNKGGKNES